MARDKAKFDSWIQRIINDFDAEGLVFVSANDLEPRQWNELWRIFDKYESYIGNGQASGNYQILDDEAYGLAKGVLLEAAGSSYEDYEIDQEVARLMDKDED